MNRRLCPTLVRLIAAGAKAFVALSAAGLLAMRYVPAAAAEPVSIDVSGRILALHPVPTQEPLPQPGVTVSAGSNSTLTGADGTFVLTAVEPGATVRVEDPAGAYYPMEIPAQRVRGDILLMERTAMVVQEVQVDGAFEMLIPARDEFEAFANSTVFVDAIDTPPRFRWESYPIQIYIPPCGGCLVDYPGYVRAAIAAWNEAIGFTAIVETDIDPPVGVRVTYPQNLPVVGRFQLIAPAGGIGDVIPIKGELQLYPGAQPNPANALVALHEVGHIFMLRHSPSQSHIMYEVVEARQRTAIHPDEAGWVRFIRRMPQGTDADWYLRQ